MYFLCGLRLEPLRQDILKFVEILEDFGQMASLSLFQPTVELVLALMGPTHSTASTRYIRIGSQRLNGDGYLLTVPQDDANQRVLQSYYRHQMILAYYFGDIELAYEMSSKLGLPLEDGPVAWLPSRFFFQSLVAFAMARLATRRSKRRYYLMRGRKFLTKLKKMSDAGNVNCKHLVDIANAEEVSLSSKGGDHRLVQQSYDSAISKSGRRGFLNDQALANELAAMYFLRQGDREWAATYIDRAYELYLEWGAVAKCVILESKYKDLLEMDDKVMTATQRSSTSGGVDGNNSSRRGRGDLKAKTRVSDSLSLSGRKHVSIIAFNKKVK